MDRIDHRALHQQALATANALVARITAPQLHAPTPCEAWNLQQLLDHMVGQHLGFATAIDGGDAPPSAYAPQHFTIESWHASVSAMIAAFAGAGLDDRVLEVELDPQHPLPVSFLLVAQILDTVVHTWDVARAMGETFTPSADVASFVLQIAAQVPDDEGRDRPHAAFAHSLPAHADPWPAALALLGRDSSWSPPPISASNAHVEGLRQGRV